MSDAERQLRALLAALDNGDVPQAALADAHRQARALSLELMQDEREPASLSLAQAVLRRLPAFQAWVDCVRCRTPCPTDQLVAVSAEDRVVQVCPGCARDLAATRA